MRTLLVLASPLNLNQLAALAVRRQPASISFLSNVIRQKASTSKHFSGMLRVQAEPNAWNQMSEPSPGRQLQRAIDHARDHTRGGDVGTRAVSVVLYGDYLCPYCRRLRRVLAQLRQTMGERMIYAYRHFPDERAHPGATLASVAAEAAGQQGRFWDMHDALYAREPSLTSQDYFDIAKDLGLDQDRFAADLEREDLRRHVEEDIDDGRRTGVAGTPTIYIDGVRYDGAWDFHSMLDAVERPLGVQVGRAAQAFARLPASAGLTLLVAAAAAVALANSPWAQAYQQFVDAEVGIVGPGGALSLTIGEWASEGLLTFFFLLVGLEIRREMTTGALVDRRAALCPCLRRWAAFSRRRSFISYSIPVLRQSVGQFPPRRTSPSRSASLPYWAGGRRRDWSCLSRLWR